MVVEPMLGFFSPGPTEIIIFGLIAVLLFGKRLPEVGRSLGKSFMEFKRGVQGVEDEIRSATNTPTSTPRNYDPVEDREEATAPKFEPPTSESADSTAGEEPKQESTPAS